MPKWPVRLDTRITSLLSTVHSDTPSELSLNGKWLSLRGRAAPAVHSAMYEVKCGAHFRRASFFRSAVMLGPFIQKPAQLVICVGFAMGFPVCVSSRMLQ